MSNTNSRVELSYVDGELRFYEVPNAETRLEDGVSNVYGTMMELVNPFTEYLKEEQDPNKIKYMISWIETELEQNITDLVIALWKTVDKSE